MASIVPLKNGSWQVVFKDKFFQALTGEKAGYVTFPAGQREQAESYKAEAEAMLKLGRIPDELKPENKKKRGGDYTSAVARKENPNLSTRLLEIINQYTAARRISPSDDKLYTLIVKETGNPMLS